MSKQLNELKNYPEWIDALSVEQLNEWYTHIKQSLPLWQKMGNTAELELAIKDYEIRNNIV